MAPLVTFLILDRSFDVVTPLLHNYYFQPMAFDLLNIRDFKFRFEVTKKKK